MAASNVIQVVAPAPYVTLDVAESITGYTVRAIEGKIARGDWVEGMEYRRAPDGRTLVSLEGYRKWVEKGRA